MTENTAGPHMSAAELEGRLSAQRQVIQWLLRRLAQDDASVADEIMEALNVAWPPQDHQEDPGAVPTEAFASFAAATAEMRLLLQPIKEL